MNISDCLDAAENSLCDARSYLESGDAISWVPQSLGSALLWAMEAWLLFHGHEIGHGRGWADTLEAFMDYGPPELSAELISCHAEASFLDFDLLGGLNDTMPITPMELWTKKVCACLERTEKSINTLLADIKPTRADHEY